MTWSFRGRISKRACRVWSFRSGRWTSLDRRLAPSGPRSSIIYGVAAELGAEALAICTVSNELPSGAELTAEERQTTFDEMIEVALETAVSSA